MPTSDVFHECRVLLSQARRPQSEEARRRLLAEVLERLIGQAASAGRLRLAEAWAGKLDPLVVVIDASRAAAGRLAELTASLAQDLEVRPPAG